MWNGNGQAVLVNDPGVGTRGRAPYRIGIPQSTMTPSRSKLIRTALRRGLHKRCPHCGEGRLFAGWSQLERCSVCGLVFVRNPGDTWAFTIIGDRLPIAAIIVLIYFGVVRSHRVLGLAAEVVFV